MKKCNMCGYIYEDNRDECFECGRELVSLEFKWHGVANGEYRKKYGTLPELNFFGQNGFELIRPTEPVVYSEISRSGAKNHLLGIGKNIFGGIGKMAGGLLSIARGDLSGIGGVIKGMGTTYIGPFLSVKNAKEMDEMIMKFEEDVWPRLWFAKTFVPVTTFCGEEYYSGLNDLYGGFKVFEDYRYFEGQFAFGKPTCGIMLYPDGSRFLGSFENGEPANGLELYVDGTYYVGELKNGYRNGKGCHVCVDYFYSGEFDGGCREGEGICKKKNGTIISGRWELDSPVR